MTKKTLKKVLATVLAGTCLLGVAGCGGNEGSGDGTKLNVVKGLPDYSADEAQKTLMIGGYCAPYGANINDGNPNFITEEQYQTLKDGGFDYVLTLYEQLGDTERIQMHLDCAKKAGVKVLVRWDAIAGLGSVSPEKMREMITQEWLDMESFMGIFARDEPHAGDFKALGKACDVYSQITDKYFYVNLFPNYANVEQLKADSYRDYVNRYCAIIKNNMIIEDHYPFGELAGAIPPEYGLNEGFLSNLEVIEKYSTYYGKEHWEYIQGETCGAGSKVPDYYDFRLQAYTNMCYGVINMQYFCYFSPFGATDETSAFIDGNGAKTSRWYDGKKINDEIHAFDHVYLNFAEGHKGVMTVIGEKNEKGKNQAFELLQDDIASTPRIKSIKTEQDAIVGTYQDADGRDGFMIVNYTIPGYRISNKVDVQFNEADALIYYKEGQYNLVELTNGKFSINLDAGEGIFAIPVKY